MNTFQLIISYIQKALPQLNNTSAASIFSNLSLVFSNVIDSIISEINSTSTIIDANIKSNRFGQRKYYEAIALKFQYGDSLVIPSNINDFSDPYYETIDVSKQIVKQASLVEIFYEVTLQDESVFQASYLRLNVAAEDNNGNLIPLNTTQFSSFKDYMYLYHVLGIPLNIYSNQGNAIKFGAIKCYYYSNYDLSTIQNNVISQLQLAPKSQTNGGMQSFGGAFVINQLEFFIVSKVPGVRNFVCEQGQVYVNPTTENPTGFEPFSDETDLTNGYFNFDPTVFTIIQYIPKPPL